MRVRLVIEMDTPIMMHREVTDRITDAALKVLRRRKGHLVSIYQTAEPTPVEVTGCVGVIECGDCEECEG